MVTGTVITGAEVGTQVGSGLLLGTKTGTTTVVLIVLVVTETTCSTGETGIGVGLGNQVGIGLGAGDGTGLGTIGTNVLLIGTKVLELTTTQVGGIVGVTVLVNCSTTETGTLGGAQV